MGRHRHSRKKVFSESVTQLQKWVIVDGKRINSSLSSEERHPGWNEALIDLSIVASFSVLDDFLDDVVSNGNSKTILFAVYTYFLSYYPLFSHWSILDAQLNRFSFDGVTGIALVIYNIFAISAANMALKGLQDDIYNAVGNYVIALIFLNVGIVALCIRIDFSNNKTAKYYTYALIIHHFIAIIFWAILYIIRYNIVLLYFCWTLIVIFISNRIQAFMWLNKHVVPKYITNGEEVITVPVNVNLQVERFSLFVVLAIGECVMGTVGSFSTINWYSVTGLLLATIQGYLFKLCYFDMFDCSGEHALQNAMRWSYDTGIRYGVTHMPGTMGITLSAGIIHKVFQAQTEIVVLTSPQKFLYSFAFALAIESFWHIRNTHQRPDSIKLFGTSFITESFLVHSMTILMIGISASPITNPMVYQSLLLTLFGLIISAGVIIDHSYELPHEGDTHDHHHDHEHAGDMDSHNSHHHSHHHKHQKKSKALEGKEEIKLPSGTAATVTDTSRYIPTSTETTPLIKE